MNEAGSSQSEDGYVPSAKEATDLVTKFAEVTGTDTVRHGPTYFFINLNFINSKLCFS
jgi:hypothetical protein